MSRFARELLMAAFLVVRVDKSRFEHALAIGLSLVLLSCTTSPAAKETRDDLQLKRTAAALIKRTDVDSLAAAALLSLSSNQYDSLALIARATAAEPKRADIAWLQAQVCGGVT